MVTGPHGKLKALGNLIFIMLGALLLGLDRHLHFHRLDELYTPFSCLRKVVFKHGKFFGITRALSKGPDLKGMFFCGTMLEGSLAIA